MTKQRAHGTGGLDQRGEFSWRLRYRVDGKVHTKSVRGTKKEAQTELTRLLHSADTGEHVEPSKMTVGQWIEEWLDAGAPGKLRKMVG